MQRAANLFLLPLSIKAFGDGLSLGIDLNNAVYRWTVAINFLNPCQIFFCDLEGSEFPRTYSGLEVRNRQLLQLERTNLRSRRRVVGEFASTCESRQDCNANAAQ